MPITLTENHSANLQDNLAKEKARLLQNKQRIEKDLEILNGADADLICSSFFPNGDKFEGSRKEKEEELLQMQKHQYEHLAACISLGEICGLKNDSVQNFFRKLPIIKSNESNTFTALGYLNAVALSRTFPSNNKYAIPNVHFAHWKHNLDLEVQEIENMESMCREMEEHFLLSDIKRQMVLLEKNSPVQKKIQVELARSLKKRLVPMRTAELEEVNVALSKLESAKNTSANSDLPQKPISSSKSCLLFRKLSNEELERYLNKENVMLFEDKTYEL